MRLALFVILGYVCGIDSARLLAFFPFPVKSHHRVFQPLLRHLSLSGHEVITFTPVPMTNPPKNYTEVVLKDFMDDIRGGMGFRDERAFLHLSKTFMSQLMTINLRNIGIPMVEKISQEKEFLNLLKSDLKFDAIILESSFFQEPFIALGHRFNAPVIEIATFGDYHWNYWIHGNPFDPSYIVEFYSHSSHEMTFFERLQNSIISMWGRFTWWNFFMPKFQEAMDKYIRYPGWETRPPMMEMVRNTSIVLLNTDLALNYPYPTSPNVIEIGGLNIMPPKALPKDIQKFMDEAKDGVIYFTFGSHMKGSNTLGNLREEFSKAFGKLKQRVLWKWEKELPNTPENVMINKWFPQQEILAHQNIKLFISHGGFLSLTEAVYFGVPIVGVPLLCDQYKNVAHMTHFGYGYHLDFDNLTESSILAAINEVLSNPKYKENAMIRSRLLKDKQSTPLEKATYWVEYVLRHKGAHHLKPAISKMPWYQQVMLDVYTAISLIVILPLYILIKIVSSCFKSSKSRNKTEMTLKNKKE